MHRSFISTVIAAAIAITGVSASMAQAQQLRPVPQSLRQHNQGNEAIAGVLAGAAALFIIGKTIQNNGGFKKNTARPHNKHVVTRPSHRGHKRVVRSNRRAHGYRHGHNHGRNFRRHGH